MTQPWLESIEDLDGGAWWFNCQSTRIDLPGVARRWRLTDSGDGFQTAMALLHQQVSGLGVMVTTLVQKAESSGPAGLVRLMTTSSDGEQGLWDLTLDPYTGEHETPMDEHYRYGSVVDAVDSWRVTLIGLVDPNAVADVHVCFAPAIGPRPGLYEASCVGSMVIMEPKFRELSIDRFLAYAREWSR